MMPELHSPQTAHVAATPTETKLSVSSSSGIELVPQAGSPLVHVEEPTWHCDGAATCSLVRVLHTQTNENAKQRATNLTLSQNGVPNVRVHSALLGKERVKLIDGLNHHETMGTSSGLRFHGQGNRRQSVANSGGEVHKTSLVDHPVPFKSTQHRWIIGKLVNDVISGVQTLVVKSEQESSIVDVKNALMRESSAVPKG